MGMLDRLRVRNTLVVESARIGVPTPQVADYIAIDTETANETRGSLCSIGVAVVRGGAVVAMSEQLVNPRQDFNPYNTMVNGLDASDVANAPALIDIWPQLTALLDGQDVVAHNASFDASVLRNSTEFAGIEDGPEYDMFCTYRMAKRAWPTQPSYGLDYLAEELDIDFDHHLAGEDARACAEVLSELQRSTETRSLRAVSERLEFRPGHVGPDSYRPFSDSSPRRQASSGGGPSLGNVDGDQHANSEHPLFGLAVCFTGTLASMPRRQASEEVSRAGADFKSGVSKKLNILVVGDADYLKFSEGWETSKLKKAKDLSAQGAEIEIMSERDFLRMLDG